MPINQTSELVRTDNSISTYTGYNVTGTVNTLAIAQQAGKKVRIFWVVMSSLGTHRNQLKRGATLVFEFLTSTNAGCSLNFGDYPLEISINANDLNWGVVQSVAGASHVSFGYEITDE